MSDPPVWWLRYHGLDDAGGRRQQSGGGNRSGGNRGSSGPKVAVEGEVTGATEKAVKFIVAATGEEVWLPKSQVSETETGLLIPQWLAQKNGLA